MGNAIEMARPGLPHLRGPLPGPRAKEIIARDQRAVSPSYTRCYPLVAARGEGAIVEDVDGNRFLDFNAGIAVVATGHCHPRVVEAIQQQAARLIHMSGTDFYYEDLVRAGRKAGRHRAGRRAAAGLVRQLGRGGRRGRHQAGALLHRARQVHRVSGRLPRPHHGGALAHRAQGRAAPGLRAADSGRVPRALPLLLPLPVRATSRTPARWSAPASSKTRCSRPSRRAEEVAAIVIEPVQGEGGYIVPPRKFFDELQRIAGRYGILLILDEVQSGMGRTGKMWAAEHFDVVPDIFAVAKGIASGMPLGATVARAELMKWPPGAHASTFGGNPVACAAALATIELLEEGLVENAARMGEYLMERLREWPERFPRWARCAGWGS